jgi:hypothetical protein
LTTFIDHRHESWLITDTTLHPSGINRGAQPAGQPETNKLSITGSLSPKRCSTTPARQKDKQSHVGITCIAGAGVAVGLTSSSLIPGAQTLLSALQSIGGWV